MSEPWGVLGAHEKVKGKCNFSVDDVNFLQSVANTLWLAIHQVASRQQLEGERRELRQLTDGIPFQMAVVSPDQRFVLNNEPYSEWGHRPSEIEGRTIRELFGDDTYARARPYIEAALAGEFQQFELPVSFPGQNEKTLLITLAPRTNSDDEPYGFYSLAVDITDRKRDELRTKAISAELDHRVKNILATVNSVARLTARRAHSLDSYRESLEARIQAMARAHATLAEGRWRGLAVRSLLEQELKPYTGEQEEKISLDGGDAALAPAAAQSMALAIHELATNAAKYGALSQPIGTLSVTWEILKGSNGALRLTWREDGLSGLVAPERPGFGMTVIGRIVRDQLKAKVSVQFLPTGLLYTIEIPSEFLMGN